VRKSISCIIAMEGVYIRSEEMKEKLRESVIIVNTNKDELEHGVVMVYQPWFYTCKVAACSVNHAQ
jgi:hypothetical protein